MASKEKREEIFASYPIPRAVAALAVPSVLSSIVNVIYNMADTYFVSLMKNTNATAAVSLTMPVFLIFVAFANIYGVGGSSYISRSMGEGKHHKVKKISAFSILTALASSLVVMALILIFINPLVVALGATNEDTTMYAYDYLKYIALGAPAIVLTGVFGNLVRGEGSPKVAMAGMMIGAISNIILDPIMILVFDMGVGGAAVATVIGNIISVIYYFIYFSRGRSTLSFSPKHYSVKEGIAKNVIFIGVPAALNNILMSLSNIVLNNFMKTYGEEAVAALGIASKVNMLIVFVQMGVGIGIQPLIGYSYGAKNLKRLKATMKFSMLCTLLIGSVLATLYFIFSPQIINVFNGEKNQLVTDYGVKILRALNLAGPFIGILFVFNFSFQGMGKSVSSFILSISRQGFIFLPLLFLMNKYVGFDGIVYAQPLSDLACIVLAFIMFLIVNARLKKDKSFYPDK